MPFHLIKGSFHVVGYAPDGDSIRFQAENEAHWARLSGPPASLNARRHAQLRLEATDTLETHFRNMHQPLGQATRAMDFLLHELNITEVQWDVLRTRISAANDGTEGYVVTRNVEQYRRPVAFAFAGAAPETDGSQLFLDAERLRESVNYRLVEAGLAYPTFYTGLFWDLREAFVEAVTQARAASREIWSEDVTNSGFEVESVESISERHVIMPKLFRRLAEYLEGGGSIEGFKQFLEQKAEGITVLSAAHFTHFDTIAEVDGNRVKMTERPENLVFAG
ncbi:MAG: nuclease [Gammaproteobacteria bacterium]|nr:nuclease [Gammaproteobacteria bacterium]